MKNQVDSISINEILNRAIRKLAGLGLDNLLDFLSVDDTDMDGLDVINDIFLDTIDRFDYLEPLDLPLICYVPSTAPYTFVDNFDLYLKGKVTRGGLQMIPRKIVSITDIHLGTLRNLVYEPPTIIQHNLTGTYRFNCFVNRPFKLVREGMKYSDDSVIYFLGKLNKPRLSRFRNQFLLNLMNQVIRLDRNLVHPNIPIETWQGLSDFKSELESAVREDFEISHGYYGVYSK